ncbi:hypothetical protein HYT57_05345 [Candidatus Woesearchaeota archaeon]|nr:hypothetical protein [Candidatus Woesearchaeota archaeon]
MVFEICCETHWETYVRAYCASVSCEDYRKLSQKDRAFMAMVFLHLNSCESCLVAYRAFLNYIISDEYPERPIEEDLVRIIKNERQLEDVLRKK